MIFSYLIFRIIELVLFKILVEFHQLWQVMASLRLKLSPLRGVLVLLKIQVNSQKVQVPQNFEFE